MRRVWLISAGVVFILSLLVLVWGHWAVAIHRLILEGVHVLVWLAAAMGLGAGLLRVLRVKLESKSLFVATATALGLGTISLLMLGLGLSGLASRGSVIGLLAIGWIVGAIAIRKIKFEHPIPLGPWLLLLMPGLALAIMGALVLPGVLWSDEPAGYDVLAYHFQVPREWYELGRILPLKHNIFSYFPFNVEMHYLLAMHLRGGAYEGMHLAQLMHVAFVALSVIAVMGAFENPRSQKLGALMLGGVPWLIMLAPTGYNEGGLLLFGTLAVVWSLRATESRSKTSAAIIAGAMAGFACGSKLTGIPMLLLAIPLVGVISRRLSLKSAVLTVGVALLTLSPWLIRNQVWAGNPVFPEAAGLLGRGHLTPDQIARWTDAHRPVLGGVDRAAAVWLQILGNWRWGYTLLPLAMIAFLLDRRRSETRFLAGVLLVQFIFWVGFTHVQSRFFIMAAPIAVLLVASIDTLRWRMLATGGAIISAVVGWAMLGRTLLFTDAPGISIGQDDYRDVMQHVLLPPDVAAAVFDSQRLIVLVGEAQAFRFSIPMSRLNYRSVFDVVEWIDPSLPPDAVIVVDPGELGRLSRHYTHLPPLSAWAEGRLEPFILPR